MAVVEAQGSGLVFGTTGKSKNIRFWKIRRLGKLRLEILYIEILK